MKPETTRDNRTARPGLAVSLLMLCSAAAVAQVPVDDAGRPLDAIDEGTFVTDDGDMTYDTVILGSAELEQLVGPIALYPDDLLAIVLPASTYPLEIVQAARLLEQLETDPSLEPDSEWDESVVALLNYPEVVRLLNEDIDWTWKLGEAVVNQQDDVVAAVEAFRDRAYAAGNLQSDEHQQVNSNAEGIIEIVPIEDDVIYVPYYEPERVVVRQPTRVYHYYPRSYPVYYYPYPAGHAFSSGYFWGVTTAYHIGWLTNSLHVRHHSYWGHPYYGHHYYGDYYRRPSISVYNRWYVDNRRRSTRHYRRDGDHWRPRRHRATRHKDRHTRTRQVRNDMRDSRGRSNERTIRFRDRSSDRTRRTVAATERSGSRPVRANNSGERRVPDNRQRESRERRRDNAAISLARNDSRPQRTDRSRSARPDAARRSQTRTSPRPAQRTTRQANARQSAAGQQSRPARSARNAESRPARNEKARSARGSERKSSQQRREARPATRSERRGGSNRNARKAQRR